MVAALDLKSSPERGVGSIPAPGTTKKQRDAVFLFGAPGRNFDPYWVSTRFPFSHDVSTSLENMGERLRILHRSHADDFFGGT